MRGRGVRRARQGHPYNVRNAGRNVDNINRRDVGRGRGRGRGRRNPNAVDIPEVGQPVAQPVPPVAEPRPRVEIELPVEPPAPVEQPVPRANVAVQADNNVINGEDSTSYFKNQ